MFSSDDEEDDIDFAAELTEPDELDNDGVGTDDNGDGDGTDDNGDGDNYEEHYPKKKKGNNQSKKN